MMGATAVVGAIVRRGKPHSDFSYHVMSTRGSEGVGEGKRLQGGWTLVVKVHVL